jgi:chromosome partitioning protein
MRIVTVFNHKGGCGKTTTAINLASTFAELGRRVLLVDLDPQAHATIGCGVREDEVELSTWDVLRGLDAEGKAVGLPDVAWEIFDRLYLAPSSVALATLEQTLARQDGRETRLATALADAEDRYDVVIVDCGPGLGLLSINALMAATDVIIPVDLGYFSVYGLGRALETVDMIAQRTGRDAAVHILATMYDSRARTMRRALSALRDQYGAMVLDTVIRFNVTLREAAALGSPICEFRPGSRGHQDYKALAQALAASELHRTFEEELRLEAEDEAREEAAVDEKIEMVYGAIPIEGGVRFVCHAPGARRVQIAGDFNQWNLSTDGEMNPTEKADVWEKEVRLPPGRYAYRLIIDDTWCSDPANPYVESNPYGELNSVVEVS